MANSFDIPGSFSFASEIKMSTSELVGDIASSADAVAMSNTKEAGVAVVVEAIAGSKGVESSEKTINSGCASSKEIPIDHNADTVDTEVDVLVTEPNIDLDDSANTSGGGHDKAGPIFPAEIVHKIIAYAMTADNGGKIVMPCLTNRDFAPKIAVGLLRVNHTIYQEATLSLLTENQLVFDHFGSDLRKLDKPTMISSCIVRKCTGASTVPYFRAMRFELGSEVDTYMGMVSIDAFQSSLLGLRRPIFVEKLTLHFHIFSSLTAERLDNLIVALQRVTVARILTVTGPGRFQYAAAALEIAVALGMIPKPTWEFMVLASSRDYAASLSTRGFSYSRFKTASDTPDYDWYEGMLIEKAATTKDAHIHGFDMRV